MAPLSQREVERLAGKYSVYERLRHSLAALSRCEEFLDARSALLKRGYFDWHIFDALIHILAQLRFGEPTAHTGEDLGMWGTRMLTYLEAFYEFGDEPLPLPGSWTAAGLENQVIFNGSAWLARQGFLPRDRPVSREDMKGLLRRHGYFDADPKPTSFVFPRLN